MVAPLRSYSLNDQNVASVITKPSLGGAIAQLTDRLGQSRVREAWRRRGLVHQ